MRYTNIVVGVIISLLIFSCGEKTDKRSPKPVSVKEVDYKIVNRFAHDGTAFTQGLEYDGELIVEGTGQNGTSWISELDPASYTYTKRVALDKKYFGEGITLMGSRVYQLTYRSKKGFVYDRSDYNLIKEFEYDKSIKEGWGLTNDGNSLIVSDGTSNLYYLDTVNFEILKTVPVTDGTSKVPRLNELEYVDGYIYANVWQTPKILKIDVEKGSVIKTYDLSDIERTVRSGSARVDVLNGIAYNTKKKTFLVTGKYWPYYYELRLED